MKKLYLLLPMMMSLCSSQAAWWNPLSWGKNTSSTPHTLSTTHTQNNNISSPLADHTHIKVTPQGDQFITHKALQRIREENQPESGLYKHTHVAPTPTSASAVADVTLSRMFEKQIGQRSEILKPFVKNEEFSSFISRQAQQELNDQAPTNLMTAAHRTLSISNLYLRPYIAAEKKRYHDAQVIQHNYKKLDAAQVIQRNYRKHTAEKQFKEERKNKLLKNILVQHERKKTKPTHQLYDFFDTPEQFFIPDYYRSCHLDTLKSINTKEKLNKEEKVLQDKAKSQALSAHYGAKHCYNIVFDNKTDIPQKEQQQVEAARNILSYLYTHCYEIREDKKGFHEGTFFVKDKKLAEFFRKYYNIAQKKNENRTRTEQINAWLQSEEKIYIRSNSHYFEDSFGIDLPEPFAGKFETILVGFKSNKDTTDEGVWIKPELKGCNGAQDTAGHAMGFFGSQKRKIAAKWSRKSANDSPDYNKEHTPKNEIAKFHELFKESKEKYEYPEPLTLSSMYQYAQQQSKKIHYTQEKQKKFNNFVNDLARSFPHIEKGRQGREIFLTEKNLISSYFMSKELHSCYKKTKDDTTFIELYHEIIKTKDKINRLKVFEKSRKEEQQPDNIFAGTLEATQKSDLPDVKKQIRQLISHINEKNASIFNKKIRNYLIEKAKFFTNLLKKNDTEVLEILTTKQIFDREYHKNVLDAQQEYTTNTNK